MVNSRNAIILIGLAFSSCVVIVLSILIGRIEITSGQLLSFLLGETTDNVALVIKEIRGPRILCAFLIGGALSLTGATYQGLFRNPMVSPSILGVSSGAGFGAALALTLSLGVFWVQCSAFIFGIIAVVIVYAISKACKTLSRQITLILSGMVVAAVFTALISVLKYAADPYDTLPSIVYWLMGGLSHIEPSDLFYLAVIIFPLFAFLSAISWKLDILSFGDDEARSMGIPVERLRITVVIAATVLTATAVSVSGIIGWVGLIVPHLTRFMLGARNIVLLPGSFFVGGIFLLLVDNFSRSVSAMELPLGITTSLLGAPFFIFILLRSKRI